jgi:GGDEF domain-containing protein
MALEDVLKQMKDDQDRQLSLSNSAMQAANVNPDQQAGAVKLAQQSGLPVHQFPAMSDDAKLQVLTDNFHTLSQTSPKSAAWLTDPENAKLAHDDVNSASKIEGLFGYLNLAKQAAQNAIPMAGKGINELMYNATLFTGGQALSRAMGTGDPGAVWLKNMDWYNRRIKSNEKIVPGSYGQELTKMTFDTVAANLITLPLGAIGKVPMLLGFAATAPGQLEDYLKAGYSPAQSAYFSLSNKSMEGLTELIGVQHLYKAGKPIGKKIAGFMLGDLFGEEINNAYSALMDKGTLKPDMTLKDFGRSVIDTAIVTAAAGGVQGAMLHPVAKLSQEYQRNQQAALNKDFMLALGEAAGESKLRQRLPEKFQELVGRLKEGGDIENVYIPGDQWKQYWQEKGADPVKMADDTIDGGGTQYTEALAAGGDIVIPIEVYANKLAATEHHVALLEHSRLHPGDATAFEAAQFAADQEQLLSDLKVEADGATKERPSYFKVYDDIYGQLQGIGYDRQTAEQYATIAAVRAKQRAAVLGKDAFDLYNESPLKIVRPLPEGVQRQSVDMGIDPLLDRLRAGDIPTDESIFGQSLLQFVRDRGVKDDRGELKSMDADTARKPGQKNIIRKDGQGLDRVQEGAVEAGYLPEGSTIADLLDKIDQELRGTPVYSNQVTNPQGHETKLALEELKQHLDQVGIDYNQLSNEQIRRELYQMQGGELFQTAIDSIVIKNPVDNFDLKRYLIDGIRNGTLSPDDIANHIENILTDRVTGFGTDVGRIHALNNTFAKFLQDQTQDFGYADIDLANLGGLNAFRGSNEGANKDFTAIAKIIEAEVKAAYPDAMLFRHGGDEMTVIAPGAIADDLDSVLEKAKSKVDAYAVEAGIDKIPHSKDTPEHPHAPGVSIYFGTTDYFDKSIIEDIIKSADRITNDKKILKAAEYVTGKQRDSVRDQSTVISGEVVSGPDGTGSGKNKTGQELGNEGVKSAEQRINDFVDQVIYNSSEEQLTLFQSVTSSTPTKRGFFRTSPDMTTREIGILKDADLSTFIHEISHSWLEELKLDASRPDAPEQLKNDWATISKWLGTTNGEISREMHEQFARSGESYLMEGKAPSAELQPIFQRFKSWLTSIYKTLSGLNVKMNDDVRGVFDRLLASESEIKQARQAQNMVELFVTKEDAGMTDAEFAAYRKQAAQAHAEEVEKLERKLMKEKAREHAQWWKDAREAMLSEVEVEAQAAPVYRAIRLLSTGKMFDGTEGPVMKLDRSALVKMYGEPFLKRLPRGFGYIYTNEGGMHPDQVAALFDYESGDAMIKEMIEAPPLKKYIEGETDIRMRERYGDMLLDGTVADEALAAIHGDSRAVVLAAELRAIKRQQKAVKPAVDAATREADQQAKANSEYERRWFEAEKNLAVAIERGAKEEEIRKLTEEVKTAKEADRQGKRDMNASIPSRETFQMAAAQIISDKKIGDIAPRLYLEAERRAGKKAFDAVAKKDWQAAGEAKQQQLLNHYLYREATAAQEQIDGIMKGYDKLKKSDEKLAKSRDINLVNAARAILSRYQIDKNGMDAAEYLAQIQQYNPEIYADLSAAVDAATQAPKPYKQLTMDEFLAVNDAVMNLWELSRRTKQIEIDGKIMNRDEVIDELNARMEELGLPANQVGKATAITKWEKFNAALVGMRAATTRVEAWVDAMDGGKSTGVFRRYIWNPVIDGVTKYRTAKKAFINKYLELLKPIEAGISNDKIAAPELDYTFNGKQELLGALLHIGNESNMEKLLVGRQWGYIAEDGGLYTGTWDSFINRMIAEGKLTRADYDFIQGVWDLLEEAKPLSQKAHHEMYGYYFSEITANPVNTPFGTYRGGYAPAIVDSDINQDQASRQEKESLESTNNSFMFPSTGRGFTKSRVTYNKPLVLDLRLVPSSLDKVLRFSFIEPRVKDVGRVIVNPALREVLNQFNPSVGGDMLVPWLQRTARQSVSTPSTGTAGRALDTVFQTIRRNTGIQMMVANVSNTIQQFTGLALSATKVKPTHLKSALWKYVNHPMNMAEEVASMSEFMAANIGHSAYDMQQQAEDILLNPNAYEKVKDFSVKNGYILQQITQHTVDVITWSGAYDQAVAEGANERDAVRRADSAVRMTQGTFNAEDVSRLETGSPFVRAFTQFYTYFNMQANLLGSAAVGAIRENGVKGAAPTLLKLYSAFAVAAILSEAITFAARGGKDPDDDELDVALQLLVMSQVRTVTAMIPIVGAGANYVMNLLNDKKYDDRISTAPFLSQMEASLRAPVSLYKYAADDGSMKMAVKDTLVAIGMITGLPAGALGRPLGYLAGMEDGKYEPSGPVDLTRGLITGMRSQN